MTWSSATWGQQDSTLPPIAGSSSIILPNDFSLVDYYLITVDVGDKVWDNFGHTALRVVDRNSNSDIVFNWGMFDASGGSVAFASDFFRGDLNYRLGVSPPQWEFNRYTREQRTVWQDKLNLTNQQKATLYRRLAWNLRDENIAYSYQYFFDNCTTRVRDYLNEALGGSLAQNNSALSTRTFRDEVRAHYQTVPPIAFGLDVVMNSRIDRRMTQWEELFLPARLRDELLGTRADVNQGGQTLNLLSEDSIVAQFDPPTPPYNIYYWMSIVLFGAAIGLSLQLKRIPIRAISAQSGFVLSSSAISYRLMGLICLLIALLSGGFGLAMAIAWRESGHLDLHHNVNLLLFWPTDLLGAYYSAKWMILGRPNMMAKWLRSLVITYMALHCMLALAYVFIAVTGLSAQAVAPIVMFLVLPLLVLCVLISLCGFKSIRRMRFN